MARTVKIERNMKNLEARYFATGDSLWRLIEYFASVANFSNVVGYVKNIYIIFQQISIKFHWYDKISCIRVKYAIIYWYKCFDQQTRYRMIVIELARQC
jgi:hypothetical protein